MIEHNVEILLKLVSMMEKRVEELDEEVLMLNELANKMLKRNVELLDELEKERWDARVNVSGNADLIGLTTGVGIINLLTPT